MPEEFREGWKNAWLQRGFRPVQTAEYRYQNVDGNDVVRKTRFSLMRVSDGKDSGGKTFIVQHRKLQSVILGADSWSAGIGREGWEKGLLYRRTSLEEGLSSGRTIYLCEGEKDADAVANAWGLCTTSHYQGSAGMKEDQAKVLLRAEEIYIIADRDAVGYQLAWHHATMLKRLGFSGKRMAVVLPKVNTEKADISDHISAGLGPRDVRLLPPGKLRKRILEIGTLAESRGGGSRRWGYGYGGNDDLGEWVVSRVQAKG